MIKVEAKKTGFFGGRRYYHGDVFELKDKSEVGKWMKVLDEPVKEKVESKPKKNLKKEEKINNNQDVI